MLSNQYFLPAGHTDFKFSFIEILYEGQRLVEKMKKTKIPGRMAHSCKASLTETHQNNYNSHDSVSKTDNLS